MFAKKTVSILLILSICGFFIAGCTKSQKVTYKYSQAGEIKTVETQVLSENDNLKLSWDDTVKGIILENKKTGKQWRNFSVNQDGTAKPTSTLDISVQDMHVFQSEYISGLDALNDGKISAEKTENGICVTYYFDKVKVSVPVSYTLREDSMLVSIDGSKVTEDGENYRVLYAAPCPSMMDVKKTAKDSYAFVPGTIGSIVNVNESAEGQKKVTSGIANVAALSTEYNSKSAESSGMRVFGMKNGNETMFCIPEKNPAAVGIYASLGDKKSDYSTLYPKFYFVDSDSTMGKATNAGAVTLLSDRMQGVTSVGFYPLSGENADYNGMAKCYRNYLIKNGYISEEQRDFDSPYAITALGGIKTTSSIMGIPVKTLKTMTTFEDVKEIVDEISGDVGVKPVVRLKGFGESGLNAGKIAGGYTFSSKFGSDKDRQELEEYCKNNGITMYSEFELINFAKSGNGFSYTNDAAKTATLHTAELYGINIPLRDTNKNDVTRLLGRNNLKKAVDKLIKLIDKKDISAVSVASLGSVSYSDYTHIKYAVAGNIETDSKKLIESLKKTNKNVSGSASTYFAAGIMDTVFEAPLEKSGKYQYDNEIPFYQLVFSGITPMYSYSVNVASNPDEKIMLAAASGTGLGFSVIGDYDTSYMENSTEKLYSCTKDHCKDMIKSSLRKYLDVYNAVKGTKIDRYEIVDSNITKTVFENGVTVWANHSSKSSESPVGNLDGYGFKMESDK